MSDYIIHNINLKVIPQFDFDGLLEQDKPADKYPNYYVGKVIGGKGKELNLKRTRKSGEEEHVPNLVLRNEDGIALIRIHNKEVLNIVNLPQNAGNEVTDCDVEPRSSYPFGYVVVDYRDGKCQLAIEKTSAWESKTVTIRNSLEDFFNDKLFNSLGISTKLEEKNEIKDFEKFIDQRTIDHGDVIESFTFEYVNLKRNPTARVPETLAEQMDMYSKILEIYGAVSGTTTMNMGSHVDNEKLKQLSMVVGYTMDNAFDLIVKFKDYGEYSCKSGVVAKYPMNDMVINNFKGFEPPSVINIDFDLRTWLDDVFNRVKGINDGEKYQPNQLNKLKEYYRKHPYYKLCKTVFKTFQEIYPTMVMTPEQLFVDASQTLDKLIQDGDLTTELCQELWTDKYNQYRERDKMAVSEDGTKTEVAMLFYVVMYGLQTINHSHYRGTLQRTLHDSIWKLYGQKECIDIEQRLRETVNQHTAEMLAWMKEYFVSEQSLSNEFGTVLHPPKQNKPKNTVERKYSGKPKTLRYLCNANNGHQNQRKERLKYVFQFWQAWKWIDANVKSEDFNSLFDGADRYCNFAFGKNITILTLFLQDLLTYKNREGCYIVEHQTNQSPSSIVKEQFNKTPNFDSKRLTDTDKQNIDLCIYTLDTANISSLDERNNEDWSYDNKELLQLVASWKINLDKQAEQEIVTGKLRSTKRI